MTYAGISARSRTDRGHRPGSAPARAGQPTCRPDLRSFSKTASAARRDRLRHRPSGGRRAVERCRPRSMRAAVHRDARSRQAAACAATVVAEVGYLLAREAGPHVESMFLASLAAGDFTAVELTTTGYARMAELIVKGDLPLGTTDASVIAIAERLKLTEAATSTGGNSLSSAPAM